MKCFHITPKSHASHWKKLTDSQLADIMEEAPNGLMRDGLCIDYYPNTCALVSRAFKEAARRGFIAEKVQNIQPEKTLP